MFLLINSGIPDAHDYTDFFLLDDLEDLENL